MHPTFRPQLICICLMASLGVTLVGCSKAPDRERASSSAPERSASHETSTVSNTNNIPPLSAPSATSDSTQTLNSQVVNQQTNHPALANKQLVITANARFEVEDVVQSVNQIEKLTLQNNGYIADSRIDNKERGRSSYAIGNQQQKLLVRYVRQATMLVRVPKSQVGEFLTQLQTQIKFLENSQFSAKDVTLELQKAQLEAQIQASKQNSLEKQNLNNKDEKTQAGNVALIEQSTLAQQEKMYAQLQQQELQDQINLSTISLSFSQPEKIRTEIVPDLQAVIDTEKTETFGSRLVDNLKTGWIYFMEFLLWLTQMWVFLLGLGLVIWVIRWWHKRTAHLGLPKMKKPRNQPSQRVESEKNVTDNNSENK